MIIVIKLYVIGGFAAAGGGGEYLRRNGGAGRGPGDRVSGAGGSVAPDGQLGAGRRLVAA